MSETNIRLLAKELGLSISTVSKALKDSYEISAETKKRVAEVARQMHYSPNPYASSLRRKKSNTIAVVIPEVADSFFSQAIKGIEEVAQQKGYHVLIYLTYESVEKEKHIMEDFKSGRVDGVLISISNQTADVSHIKCLHQNNIPVVYFDRACLADDAAKITTNDFESGYLATQHLIERGCQTIYFLSISNLLAIDNDRLKGYRQALADHNMPFKNKFIIHCSNSEEKNTILLKKMLLQKDRPNGILSAIEKLVTPVYSLCQLMTINIPGDIKVMSFSNSPIVHILNPSLTTITQPAFDMGKAAATVLFKALHKPLYPLQNERIVINSTLIKRDSTR